MLFGMLNDEGFLLFSPNDDITEADVPDERADSMTNQKTQAQRLRGALYRLYEQQGSKGDFESFYRTRMERMIDAVKANLD